MSVLALPHPALPSLPQAPATALGDLGRATATTPAWRRAVSRAAAFLAAVMVGACAVMSLTSTTASAFFLDDTVSQIMNFCQPNDVDIPSTAYSGLEGMIGLSEFSTDKQTTQATALPEVDFTYADDTVLAPSYQRYGFSALTLSSYGTGCGAGLIAKMAPMILNPIMGLFVYFPVALTMLSVKMALSGAFASLVSALLTPVFFVMAQVMRPIVLILAAFGTIYALIRWKGRLGKVVGATVYAVLCGAFVMFSATNDDALGILTETADKIVTEATATVTSEMAKTAFPSVKADGSAGDSTVPTGSAYDAINNSLWKGIPLATWTTAQMGSQAADAAWNGNGDKFAAGLSASQWQARILNSKHVGVTDAEGSLDEKGQKVMAGVESWNSRSYQTTAGNAKTDLWTEGIDPAVDVASVGGTDLMSKNDAIWVAVPQLADIGLLCGDDHEVFDGKGSGEASDNRWFFNGSCSPADAGASAFLPYFRGMKWYEAPFPMIAGSVGAVTVLMMSGFIGLYVCIQKALMYWLLAFAPVFIGIAAFGDDKRRAFARAFFGEFFANVMKQVAAVSSLVVVSYLISSIVVSKDVPFFMKPTIVMILGASLWLLALIARKIAKAAIAGDTSIVRKTAGAPVRAAKTAAKAAAVTGAVVATGGAAAAVAGAGGLAGMSGAQALGTAAKGALSPKMMAKGAKGLPATMAERILTNPQARQAAVRVLGRGKVGAMARRGLALNDMISAALAGPGASYKDRLANDQIAQWARSTFGNPPAAPGSPATRDQAAPAAGVPGAAAKARQSAAEAAKNSTLKPGAGANINPAHEALTTGRHATAAQAMANSQASYQTPPGQEAPIGNRPPQGQAPVVTRTNQENTVAAMSLAAEDYGKRVQVLHPKMSPDQVQATVNASLNSASGTSLTNIPVTVNPTSVSAETFDQAMQMVDGNINAMPSAIQTLQVASEGQDHVASLIASRDNMMGALQSQVTGGPVISGDTLTARINEVASQDGVTITQDSAVANPVEFLTQAVASGVYGDSGSLMNLNPQHGAAEAMQAAFFAATSETMPEEDKTAAFQYLSGMIDQYGLPSAVADGALHAAANSELAERSGLTMTQAAAMAATYQPGEGLNAAEYGAKMKLMYSTLSEDAQDSGEGVMLRQVVEVASNPGSTIGDVEAANAAFVTAFNASPAARSLSEKEKGDPSEFLARGINEGLLDPENLNLDQAFRDPTNAGAGQAAIAAYLARRDAAADTTAEDDDEMDPSLDAADGGFANISL